MNTNIGTNARDLERARQQFAQAIKARKCHGCGCFLHALGELERNETSAGALSPLLAEAKSVTLVKEHDCLGCAECDSRPRLTLGNAIVFVFGVVVATPAMGATAVILGHTVTSIAGSRVRYAVAPVPIIMGLYAFGWIRLPLGRSLEVRKTNGVAGTFFTGFALSLVFAPCGSPVLAAILSYAAYQDRLLYGALLMFLYGVGIGIPIMLIGTGASRFSRRLAGATWQGWVNRTAGVVLPALGFYFLWTA